AVATDLYARWRPAPEANVIVGRARVPWSKPRQIDELEDPFGAPPFVVDRIAPDRRWGALLLGERAHVAYSAGVWEDLDALEPRIRVGDASAGGALAAAAWLEWTPGASLENVGGPLPARTDDPRWEQVRLSFGAGALGRTGDRGGRFDGAL